MPLSKIDTRSVLFSTIAHRGPEMTPEPKPRVTPRRKYSKMSRPRGQGLPLRLAWRLNGALFQA
jgi:hypothetical protein